MTTATFKLSQSNFSKGLKYARQWGGTYDPTTKTWTIQIAKMGGAINAPQAYGLIPVAAHHRAQHDANCPAVHGLACECHVRTQ
jgi:hypothetical protein